MDSTPIRQDGHDPNAAEGREHPGLERIYSFGPREATGGPHWNLEMLESPLMGRGLTYKVSDGSSTEAGDEGNGWIDFELQTRRYLNAAGRNRVQIRLSVTRGRLAITAPGFYPQGSLKRATKPPPDADGNLRVVRLGDAGTSCIDLIMAADGTVTAVLLMESIQRPFNRADIVRIAEEFTIGLDYLDFAVHKGRLLLPRSGGSQ